MVCLSVCGRRRPPLPSPHAPLSPCLSCRAVFREHRLIWTLDMIDSSNSSGRYDTHPPPSPSPLLTLLPPSHPLLPSPPPLQPGVHHLWAGRGCLLPHHGVLRVAVPLRGRGRGVGHHARHQGAHPLRPHQGPYPGLVPHRLGEQRQQEGRGEKHRGTRAGDATEEGKQKGRTGATLFTARMEKRQASIQWYTIASHAHVSQRLVAFFDSIERQTLSPSLSHATCTHSRTPTPPGPLASDPLSPNAPSSSCVDLNAIQCSIIKNIGISRTWTGGW